MDPRWRTRAPIGMCILCMIWVYVSHRMMYLPMQLDDAVAANIVSPVVVEEKVDDIRLEESKEAVGEHPKVKCLTTKGEFTVEVYPEIAPNGSKFFLGLVDAGYFDQNIPFFRVNNHLTQFGITKRVPREEDPFIEFREGALRDENPYGGIGMDSESVQKRKDHPWERGTFASIGGFHFVVVIGPNKQMGTNRHDAKLGQISAEDMDNVFSKLFCYNDIINNRKGGAGVDQTKLMQRGNEWVRKEFPECDFILKCCRQ